MEDKDVEVLEEKKSKRKSGNTVGVIFVALLLVGLSVACGWFANSYFNNLNKNENGTNNSEKKEDNNDEQWKSLGTDLSKVKNVYDVMFNLTYDKSLPKGVMSLNDDELVGVIISVMNLGAINSYDFNEYKYRLNHYLTQSRLKEYFGDSYELTTGLSGNSSCSSISNYDDSSQTFVVRVSPCDGNGPSGPNYMHPTDLRKVYQVFENINEIKVIEKVIYYKEISYSSEKDSHSYNIYSNPEKTNLIGKLEKTEMEYDKNYVEQFLDKAGTITSYYHKAEDGSYYFVSSEIS